MAKTIAIDIGHGSDTFPPSKGIHRHGKAYPEHDFNSKVGVELNDVLQANGFDTIMYQKPNAPDVPLWKRTNYYNAKNVDLVWSIHANFNNKESVEGRCAFYWHNSKESKQLAELYANECHEAGYETHGNGLHASKLGSWTNLAICRETNMTAVLTENGFMSNDEAGTDDDFELIFGGKQAEYVKSIARVHAKAIARFFNERFEDKDTGSHYEPPKQQVKAKEIDNSQFLIRVKVNNLHTYTKADWDAAKGAPIVDKGEIFTVVKTLKVNGYKMYQLKSGLYITAADKFVEVYKEKDSKPKANLKIDGRWGEKTTRALQEYLGTIVDGVISGQIRTNITSRIYGVDYGKGGSTVVKGLQRLIGAKVDGYIGVDTVRKLQQYLGTYVDGVISHPSNMIKELQRRLNKGNL